MYFQFICAILVVLFLYAKNVRTLEPIIGIYRESSKYFYLKFCAMYILLKLRKRKTAEIEELEKRHPLSENPMVRFLTIFSKSVIISLKFSQLMRYIFMVSLRIIVF